MKNRPVFVVGVDLGQVVDPSVIAVLEVDGVGSEARFAVRHLERHLQISYPAVAARVRVLTDRLAKTGNVIVGFDQGGVGRPVGDILRGEVNVPTYGISITSGADVNFEGHDYRVPKKDLVGALQIAFQNGRIRIPKGLKLAEVLQRELLNFRVSVTAAANETFDARSGSHDDTVIAVAIAVWLALKRKPGAPFFFVSAESMGASPAQLREERWGSGRRDDFARCDRADRESDLENYLERIAPRDPYSGF